MGSDKPKAFLRGSAISDQVFKLESKISPKLKNVWANILHLYCNSVFK